MSALSGYAEPIISACLLFFPVAGLFTLPFMVVQYHRYGGIPILRALVVYALILYSMCAFLLTVLPLPTMEQLAAMPARPVQYVPFSSFASALRSAGFSLARPETLLSLANWKALFTSDGLFEILANIVMQVPLGVFLRYYFRRSAKQVLLIGLCVSLFFELTQLSGLFFIYPRPYRFCSVDDLINNTLGAMIGYWIAPVLCAPLPTRDALDRMSIAKERRVTLTRRVTAAVVDWTIYTLLFTFTVSLSTEASKVFTLLSANGYIIWVAVVFVGVQRIFRGKTIGKALLRIAVVDKDTRKTPSVRQLLIRYAAIYLLAPLLLALLCVAALLMGIAVFYDDGLLRLIGIIGATGLLIGSGVWVLRTVTKRKEFPHSTWSKTVIVTTGRKQDVSQQGAPAEHA